MCVVHVWLCQRDEELGLVNVTGLRTQDVAGTTRLEQRHMWIEKG
jgi:hypothetical protein